LLEVSKILCIEARVLAAIPDLAGRAAEIAQLYLAVGAYEDILGLDVTVVNKFFMHFMHGTEQLKDPLHLDNYRVINFKNIILVCCSQVTARCILNQHMMVTF
jgi:hypothetical protein